MAERRVVNTSPLIYLSRANLLDLLNADASQVIVPQLVVNEIAVWPTADAAQKAIASLAWLATVPPEPIPPIIASWDLGLGESAVLAYGFNHPGQWHNSLCPRRSSPAAGCRNVPF